MTRLRAEALTLSYGGRPVVRDVSLDVPPGQVTVVVGANGCGKSTLLRGLGRLLPPEGGRVLLDDADITRLPTREVAQRLAILPQSPQAPDGLTVAELVARGRHPHQRRWRSLSEADERAVERALQLTDTADLVRRPVEELSGGQRQRVWLAMVLAQGAEVLLLDEPTSALDLAHALEVLDLVAGLPERGGTAVVVLHDLNLAARYADHLVAMRDGEVVAQGVPEEVITAERVSDVFGLRVQVVPDPVTGTPMVVPLDGAGRGVRRRRDASAGSR